MELPELKEKLKSKYIVRVVAGDPDELLPQFLEALDDAGIDDVIAAKQEQLDAFLAEK